MYFGNPVALLVLPVAIAIVLLAGRRRLSRLPRGAAESALAIRLTGVTALVLALSLPVLLKPRDDLTVVFAVDRSNSVGAASAELANEWVAASIGSARPQDRWAIVQYGGRPAVAERDADGRYVSRADVAPDRTDTRAGLRLAGALIAPSGASRVVVLSDGNDTAPGAAEEAAALARLGTQVSVVALPDARAALDARVDDITAPRHVWVEQQFTLVASVHSPRDGDAEITVDADGQVIARDLVTLTKGTNAYSIRVAPRTEGVHGYRLSVSMAGDSVSSNDRSAAAVTVHPPGRALVVGSDPREAQPVADLLRRNRIEVLAVGPDTLSVRLSDYEQYDLVVVANVPASALSRDRARTVVSVVDALGIGLIVTGGDSSFSQGGYQSSPIADALPVQMTVPGSGIRGPVAIVLLIDKSGSMEIREDSVRKVEMAREAAQRAVALLTQSDVVGIVAFDSSPQVLVPPQRVGDESNRGAIYGLIDRLDASGGTDVQAAIAAGIDAFGAVRADQRHIILFSDGQSGNTGPYDDLLRELKARRITLSAIAIGSDADTALLQELATSGQGRYYYAEHARDIPSLTIRETRIASGLTKVEEQTAVRIAGPSPTLLGFAEAGMGPIRGYVVTIARENASVALLSGREDPLLVHWQYGLGRVVAWTSDVEGLWSSGWLPDGELTRLWGQTARWAMRTPAGARAQVDATSAGLAVTISADIVDAAGAYQDLLDVRAQVEGPSFRMDDLRLEQVAPGRYQARLAVPAIGAYGVRLTWKGDDGIVRDTLGSFVVPYSREYSALGTNQRQLADLAQAGGGRILREPAEAFARDIAMRATAPYPIHRELLLVACILLPLDVAIRRLKLSPMLVESRVVQPVRLWLRAHRGRSGAGGG
jgi:Mg-chelatase subunit ChlD